MFWKLYSRLQKLLGRFKQTLITYYKKFKTAPSVIKWFSIIWFIGSFGMILMPFMLPFYKQNGLTNTQILITQSVFMLVSVIAEIPTGVFADKYGRKLSVVLGDITFALGILTYFLGHNFYIFILAETFMGIGRAFNSGADEALFYDTLKDLGYQKHANFFIAFSDNLNTLGFIVSNVFSMYLVKIFSIRFIFILSFLFMLIESMFYIKIPEPKAGKNSEDFVPHYLDIIKTGINVIKNNSELLFYFVLGWLFSLTAYWAGYWTLQPLFVKIGLPIAMFAGLTIFRNLLDLLVNSVWPFLYKKLGVIKLVIVNQITAYMLLILGFVLWLMFKNPILTAVFMTMGSLLFGYARRYLFKDMQEQIPSNVRATVNSFGSLVRSFLIGVLNPLVGYLADKNLLLVEFGLPLVFIVASMGVIWVRDR